MESSLMKPPVFESTSLSAARRIDAVCDRFEQAVLDGLEPRQSQYLCELAGDERDNLREQLQQLQTPERATPVSEHDSGGPSNGPAVIGHYQIQGVLGCGGFGTVYRAYDPRLDRQVALKVPHAFILSSAQHLQRAVREARIAAQLEHPHIVRIYEVIENEGVPVLVCEYVSGKSLAEVLADAELDQRARVALLAKIARSLEYAHQRGVIHRDVKPANVLIDENGEPRVTDFGLARRLQGGETLTEEGQVMGTPAYMAPEQFAGAPVDGRADIYSLGTLLYEALVGKRPFDGEPLEILSQVLHDDPPSPRSIKRDLDVELQEVTLKCLAKIPDRRYNSAAALAADLEAYLQGQPVSASHHSWRRHFRDLVRDTPHVHIMHKFAEPMLALGVVTGVFDFAVATLYHVGGVSHRFPFVLLILIKSILCYGLCSYLKAQSERPAFIERQILHLWGGVSWGIWGMIVIEAALNLPLFTLAPCFAIQFGVAFLMMTRLITRKCLLQAGLYFLCAVLMTQFPDGQFYCFGATNVLVWLLTGWAYRLPRAASRIERRSAGSATHSANRATMNDTRIKPAAL